MKKLSKTEEQVMEILWTNKKMFLKDILNSYPDPKPAITTIATLLKRMIEKGFVGYELFGNSREYYPKVEKQYYFTKHFKSIISQYFNNSALQFASFFTKSALSKKELLELQKMIDEQLKNK